MKTSVKGLKLITKFEGWSSAPYKCPAGIPTIGFGFTFYPNGDKVTMEDKPISQNEGYAILAELLVTYEKSVEKLVKVELGQGEFDALVSFCYNVGAGNLAKSTLLRELNEGKPRTKAAEHFLDWNKAGGKVLPGLVKRRTFEKHCFLGTI